MKFEMLDLFVIAMLMVVIFFGLAMLSLSSNCTPQHSAAFTLFFGTEPW